MIAHPVNTYIVKTLTSPSTSQLWRSTQPQPTNYHVINWDGVKTLDRPSTSGRIQITRTDLKVRDTFSPACGILSSPLALGTLVHPPMTWQRGDQAPPEAAFIAEEDREGGTIPPGLMALPQVAVILVKSAVQGGRNVKFCE